MHKKALSVAIAGALAAPMAAQAVDMTVSGHINRALFITDSDQDSSTSAAVKDNGSSGTRIRVTGSGEMMDGGAAGVNLEYGATDTLGLRYAELWYSGGYGKVSIGQGDQGGEGSVYNGAAAVTGTGHGQANEGVTKRAGMNYYTSLDGGAGRNERLRYDSADLGPISAAISLGNGDQVSAGLKLTQDLGGTTFKAGIGTIQWPGGKSTISASAGFTLDSGISISGAWGKGTDHAGMTIPAVAAVANTPAMDAQYKFVNTAANFDHDDDDQTTGLDAFDGEVTEFQEIIDTGNGDEATEAEMTLGMEAQEDLMALFATYACTPPDPDPENVGAAMVMDADCNERFYAPATEEGTDGSPAVAAMPTMTDPSMLQVAISYAFGDTSVGLSWYQSSDLVNEGSELTAIGVGVDHQLPKLGANVYAAAQNYKVEDGSYETDDTVIMIGTRIKF